MNVFVTSLLKIINNPDIQDTNYNIAYYLLLHYYDVFEMTLQEIADACYVSVSTLNRFFRIFGFKKFSIIKDLMQVHAAARISQLEERSIRKIINKLISFKTAIRSMIIGQYQIKD